MKLNKLKYLVIVKSANRTFLYLNNRDHLLYWKEFVDTTQHYGASIRFVHETPYGTRICKWKSITKMLKNL